MMEIWQKLVSQQKFILFFEKISLSTQIQLSNIYSIDVCYDIVMVMKLSINKEL